MGAPLDLNVLRIFKNWVLDEVLQELFHSFTHVAVFFACQKPDFNSEIEQGLVLHLLDESNSSNSLLDFWNVSRHASHHEDLPDLLERSRVLDSAEVHLVLGSVGVGLVFPLRHDARSEEGDSGDLILILGFVLEAMRNWLRQK